MVDGQAGPWMASVLIGAQTILLCAQTQKSIMRKRKIWARIKSMETTRLCYHFLSSLFLTYSFFFFLLFFFYYARFLFSFVLYFSPWYLNFSIRDRTCNLRCTCYECNDDTDGQNIFFKNYSITAIVKIFWIQNLILSNLVHR